MLNLIQELIQPSFGPNGEIVPTSTVKRRAAEALQNIMNMHQQDLQARLQLQTEVDILTKELISVRGPSLEACVDEYRKAMNRDSDFSEYVSDSNT